MAKMYNPSEAVEAMAKSLIPSHHPELATARMAFLFVDKTSRKGGRERWGSVTKVSGRWEFMTELDFIIEVASPIWNDITERQRQALVDHLLECCSGEEDEQSGEMKWSTREPDVQEFSSILQRHHVWNDSLTAFIRVAQEIDLSGIISSEMSEETEGEVEDEVEEEVEEELNLNAGDDDIDLSGV